MKKLNAYELEQAVGGIVIFDYGWKEPWVAKSDDGLRGACFRTEKEAIACAKREGWSTEYVSSIYLEHMRAKSLKKLK